MFLRLGKTPLLRGLNVFAPMFTSASAFYITLFLTIEPDYALWAGVATAALLWFIWGRLGLSLSSPAATGITFFITYWSGVFESVYGAVPALMLWFAISGYLAHHSALRAKKTVRNDKIIDLDPSVNHFDWMAYEFLAYQAFFFSFLLLMKKPEMLYVLPALFIGVFILFVWWLLAAGQHSKNRENKVAPRRRARHARR